MRKDLRESPEYTAVAEHVRRLHEPALGRPHHVTDLVTTTDASRIVVTGSVYDELEGLPRTALYEVRDGALRALTSGGGSARSGRFAPDGGRCPAVRAADTLTLEPRQLAGHFVQLIPQRADQLHGLGGVMFIHGGIVASLASSRSEMDRAAPWGSARPARSTNSDADWGGLAPGSVNREHPDRARASRCGRDAVRSLPPGRVAGPRRHGRRVGRSRTAWKAGEAT